MDWADIISAVRETGWTKDFTANCESALLSRMKESGVKLGMVKSEWVIKRFQMDGQPAVNGHHQLLYSEVNIEEEIRVPMMFPDCKDDGPS